MHSLTIKTTARPLARALPGLLLGTALAGMAIFPGCAHWQPYKGICVPLRLILA